jgi:hypothetical protein
MVIFVRAGRAVEAAEGDALRQAGEGTLRRFTGCPDTLIDGSMRVMELKRP